MLQACEQGRQKGMEGSVHNYVQTSGHTMNEPEYVDPSQLRPGPIHFSFR
jgi:hypothetical protein